MFLTSSVDGGFAPPIAAVTLDIVSELTTLELIVSDGPVTAKSIVPI